MINTYINSIVRFVFLVLIQAFVLQNINMGGFINPYLYILFVLWLPVDTEKSLVMFLAFLLGISVDVFTNSIGMHAAACVAMAFARPYVLKLISPRDDYELGTKPKVINLGWTWFLLYGSLLTFIHHFVLFSLEVFRFGEFFFTFFRTVSSTVFTLLLLVIAELLTFRSK